jgi:hypothetical protein
MPLIPATGRQRQVEFEASLVYIVSFRLARLCSKTHSKNRNQAKQPETCQVLSKTELAKAWWHTPLSSQYSGNGGRAIVSFRPVRTCLPARPPLSEKKRKIISQKDKLWYI